MKKVIKIVCLVTVLTLLAGMFTGCGKVNDKDDQGRTMISVGNWPAKEGADLTATLARKERFEQANPDVVVEGDPWTFDRKTFYAKAAGDQLPTVYMTAFTEVPEIIESEYSADLTDVLKKRGYEGMFNEKILAAVSDKDGNIMGFPYSAYVLGLAYNVDLLEKAGLMEADGTPKQPKDWNEVTEFAVKIKEATGKPGFIMPTANHVGGWYFTNIAWSFGVDFMEKGEDGKWKANFNTAEAVQALQWVKDLKWKYNVLPENNIVDMTELYKVYATGGAGMLMAAGDGAKRVVQYGMDPQHFGMMAIPAGPKRHVTLLGGSSWYLKPEATKDQIDAGVRWLETAYNFNLTEEYKTNAIAKYDKWLGENRVVGVKEMSCWSENSEALAWEHKYIDEHTNINMNHVRLYNEFCANCPAEIQAEEPVCCQELYGILDNCLQEVLSNKDADCAAVLEKANSDFQSNYLDNLTY